jgi:steroid delta-isomerase-like uncharacterized protein
MTREEIVAMFDRRRDAYARHDAEALSADHGNDTRLESPAAGGIVTGREAILKVYRAFFASFPDVSLDSIDLVVDGNRVALFATMSGTDTGGFMGLPPTGRRFAFPIALVFTLGDDGLIAHERRIYDYTGMLIQIGMLKAKPA